MAIERMKSVWLFARKGEARRVLDHLAGSGLVHVADCGVDDDEAWRRLGVERVYPDVGDLEHRVQLLRDALETLSTFYKPRREILQNFISTPLEVPRAEVKAALQRLKVDAFHAKVSHLQAQYSGAVESRQNAEAALGTVAPLTGIPGTILGRADQRMVAGFVGVVRTNRLADVRGDDRLPEACAIDVAGQRGKIAVVQVGCLDEDGDTVLDVLRDYGVEPIEPEARTVSIDDYIADRAEDLKKRREDEARLRDELTSLARENRQDLEVALGYWEERLRIARTTELLAESGRLTIVRAYVRADDFEQFEREVERDLPDVGLEVDDPTPQEKVPVSLKNHALFAPAQFLVSMLGMPNYYTFDPTVFVFFNFTIFFGLCFGDALYGMGLIAVGWLLARKYRPYVGLRYLFTLLAYAGVPTLVVGALTGSWAGNLLTADWFGQANPFLSASNPLVRMAAALMVIDLLDKLILALIIAIMIGVGNQLLAMVCLMLNRISKGDVRAGVLDTVFWLVTLPALVILAATIFTDVATPVTRTATGVAAVGIAGLVFTQGRDQKTWIGKVGVGVASLYGVAGTYGVSAFLSDTLSYSRLLALGLVTTIVAMCFNIMAGIVLAVPWLGIVLALVVVLGGNAANFFLNVLGSFVHSIRLIFVEFFGRFYESDAPTFAPIGTWSGRLRVTDSHTVWTE